MEIICLDKINFAWKDLIHLGIKNRRKQSVSPDICSAAERAYIEGTKLVEPRAIFEIYRKKSINYEKENINICLPLEANEEILFIGSKIDYLTPAEEVVIALCTVGGALTDAISCYHDEGEPLIAYYLDIFGVKVLAELSAYMRKLVEKIASQKGWGVGPSMQPGSVAGWDVTGQSDLFRLAYGDKIGLTINSSHFLIPSISSASLIGLGENYSSILPKSKASVPKEYMKSQPSMIFMFDGRPGAASCVPSHIRDRKSD